MNKKIVKTRVCASKIMTICVRLVIKLKNIRSLSHLVSTLVRKTGSFIGTKPLINWETVLYKREGDHTRTNQISNAESNPFSRQYFIHPIPNPNTILRTIDMIIVMLTDSFRRSSLKSPHCSPAPDPSVQHTYS